MFALRSSLVVGGEAAAAACSGSAAAGLARAWRLAERLPAATGRGSTNEATMVPVAGP